MTRIASPSLRPTAEKHFVVVTTDDSTMTAADFDLQARALHPSFSNYVFHGVFLLTYDLFALCGAAEGTVYKTLVASTGGSSVELCDQDFSPVWDRLTSCP